MNTGIASDRRPRSSRGRKWASFLWTAVLPSLRSGGLKSERSKSRMKASSYKTQNYSIWTHLNCKCYIGLKRLLKRTNIVAEMFLRLLAKWGSNLFFCKSKLYLIPRIKNSFTFSSHRISVVGNNTSATLFLCFCNCLTIAKWLMTPSLSDWFDWYS